MQTCIHNGTDEQKTLAALKKAASKATGKARGVLQGLTRALSHNPAARGRIEKGDASMAKKRTKRATAKRRTPKKINPTPSAPARKAKRSFSASGFAAKVKGLDVQGILLESAGVAFGGLASSFAARQAAKFLPDMNPALRTGLSTAIVAGGLAYFGKGRGFLRNMAVGAVSGGITTIASSFMPSLFAGVEEEAYGYPEMGGWTEDGTWNEELGGEMAGVLYDNAGATPFTRSF